RWRPEQGGGAVWDVGGYCVDAARLVMGEEPLAAQAVAHYAPSGIDDQLSGQLEFADGRVAHLVCSFRSAEQQRLTVLGTSGVLDIPWPFTAWRSDQAPIVVRRGAHEETLPGDPADPYQLMVAAFTAAVRDGAPVPHALAASRATLRAVTALAEAARTGQRTEISSAVWIGGRVH
ncbi:MAG TPA: Gfo/Idh/MocA family oxidoreductase, partial [Ktedonobacterales bacterium]